MQYLYIIKLESLSGCMYVYVCVCMRMYAQSVDRKGLTFQPTLHEVDDIFNTLGNTFQSKLAIQHSGINTTVTTPVQNSVNTPVFPPINIPRLQSML